MEMSQSKASQIAIFPLSRKVCMGFGETDRYWSYIAKTGLNIETWME